MHKIYRKKENVKIADVKEGTEGIVDTSTTKVDVTEDIAANTFILWVD